jgi:hypothetical protein
MLQLPNGTSVPEKFSEKPGTRDNGYSWQSAMLLSIRIFLAERRNVALKRKLDLRNIDNCPNSPGVIHVPHRK